MVAILKALAIQKAMNSGDHARAEALATDWARSSSAKPQAFTLWATLSGLFAPEDRPRRIQILREGVKRFPYSSDLIDALFSELNFVAVETGDPAPLEEARTLLADVRELLGDTGHVHLRLADLALRDGDIGSARKEALIAEEAITNHPRIQEEFDLGTTLLQIPGEEDRGRALLEKIANNKAAEVEVCVNLGAFFERRDPEAARRFLERARAKWTSAPALLEARIVERRRLAPLLAPHLFAD